MVKKIAKKAKLEFVYDLPEEVKDKIKDSSGKEIEVNKIRTVIKLGEERAEIDYYEGDAHVRNEKDAHDVAFLAAHKPEIMAMVAPYTASGHLTHITNLVKEKENQYEAQKEKNSNLKAIAAGLTIGSLLVGGAIGASMSKPAPVDNHDDSAAYHDGQQSILKNVPAWVAQNHTAWENTQHNSLESLLTGNTKVPSSVVNMTFDKLYGTHNLDALTLGQLTNGALQSYFAAGELTGPSINGTTAIIKSMINNTFDVPLEQLQNMSLISAVKAYGDLAAHEQVSMILNQAKIWNATWYNNGKQEILNDATLFDQLYQKGIAAGEQAILEKALGWGQQNFSEGHNGGFQSGYQASWAEVLDVVDALMNQTEIQNAGKNITAILNAFETKVKLAAEAKAYESGYEAGNQNLRMVELMNSLTAPYLAGQNASARNDSISLLTNVIDAYPSTAAKNNWSYLRLDDKLGVNASMNLYNDAKIDANVSKYIRNALNAGDYVLAIDTANKGNDSLNGSFVQRFNAQTRTAADDGYVTSDADYSEIVADVKGG